MTKDEARTIVEQINHGPYYANVQKQAHLDGYFTAEQVRAILTLMTSDESDANRQRCSERHTIRCDEPSGHGGAHHHGMLFWNVVIR